MRVRRLLGMIAMLAVSAQTYAGEAVSFRRDVMAVFSVAGCNSAACHGSPAGRGGFKLSLRGHDPEADYQTLTREFGGRRVNLLEPEASLILRKPLGKMPHDGGVRLTENGVPVSVLRDWLAQGAPSGGSIPTIAKLEVIPDSLSPSDRLRRLRVTARFADGTTRDVTPLTVFTADDPVATVNEIGSVEFRSSGEVVVLARYLDSSQSVRLSYVNSESTYAWTAPVEANYVDRIVFAKLKSLQIVPSEGCSDTAFMRRVYLDLCGILPTTAELREFLADDAPDKRTKLIDNLLERPQYADFWTLKWLDVLRNSRRNLGTTSAIAFQAWVRNHVEKNTPVDRLIYDLITAKGNAVENAAANFYRIDRTPEELGESVAQLFCGIRIQCAQCHNHPWDNWTQDDYFGLAAFFPRVSRTGIDGKKAKRGDVEVIGVDSQGEVTHPRRQTTVAPKLLGGLSPTISADQDRREILATWLVSADNPFFAKSYVNRLWFHLLGRGIVDPVDDFRESNPASDDELLAALADDFVKHGYDTKHLLRTILNSQTYQRSSRTNDSNRADAKYFSHARPRLLTAEQLLDSVGQVLESPERFKNASPGTRAVQLPDGEDQHPFLKAFGQPPRKSPCECERNSDVSLARALQLVNGETINMIMSNPKNRIGRLLQEKLPDESFLAELYWATVGRAPTEVESKAALAHLAAAENRRRAWEDIQWALLNTREFLYRY